MELAQRELGLEVVERPIDRSELYVCDELFLTGTAVGMAPVVRVDHRPVEDGRIGASHARVAAACTFDATRGHCARVPQVAASGLPAHSSEPTRPSGSRSGLSGSEFAEAECRNAMNG